MAFARPFAYNPGTPIPGTEQVGSLSIGAPTSGFTNNPQYWNGPDEELGYVIAQSVSGNTQPTEIPGVFASVGFFRTNTFDDNEFVQLANTVSNSNYTTASEASLGLTANGYWNSFIPVTPTPTETTAPTPTPTPTETSSPTPTPTVTPTSTDLTNITTYTISGCSSLNVFVANLGPGALAPGDIFYFEFTGGTPSGCYRIVNKINAVPTDGTTPLYFYTSCALCVAAREVTPTPTVTQTPTNTQTPTITPTVTPVYYYYFLLNCNLVDNKYGRSTSVLIGSTFNISGNTCYSIVGNEPGPYYDYDLDIATLVTDCTDVSCDGPTPTPTTTSTPTPSVTNTQTPSVTPTFTPTPSTSPVPVTGYGYNLVVLPYQVPQSGNTIFPTVASGGVQGTTNPNTFNVNGVYWSSIDNSSVDRTNYYSGMTNVSVTAYFTQNGNTAIYSGSPTAFIYDTAGGINFNYNPTSRPGQLVLIQSSPTNFVTGQTVYIYYVVNVDPTPTPTNTSTPTVTPTVSPTTTTTPTPTRTSTTPTPTATPTVTPSPTPYETLAGSLLFNGSNQTLGLSPGVTFGAGTFTLEGWFYNTSDFTNRGIIGSPVSSPTGCMNLYFANNTTITSDRNGGGGSFSYTMASAISLNQWHYFIYNRNADGTTAVYIDGVRCTATSLDTLDYNTATDTIGRYYGGYWPGNWTNMRMTIGTAVYNSNLTTQVTPRGPLTSLANTKYLMLGAVVTTDSSGIQTVTNNNGVTQTSTKPFTPPANPPF